MITYKNNFIGVLVSKDSFEDLSKVVKSSFNDEFNVRIVYCGTMCLVCINTNCTYEQVFSLLSTRKYNPNLLIELNTIKKLQFSSSFFSELDKFFANSINSEESESKLLYDKFVEKEQSLMKTIKEKEDNLINNYKEKEDTLISKYKEKEDNIIKKYRDKEEVLIKETKDKENYLIDLYSKKENELELKYDKLVSNYNDTYVSSKDLGKLSDIIYDNIYKYKAYTYLLLNNVNKSYFKIRVISGLLFLFFTFTLSIYIKCLFINPAFILITTALYLLILVIGISVFAANYSGIKRYINDLKSRIDSIDNKIYTLESKLVLTEFDMKNKDFIELKNNLPIFSGINTNDVKDYVLFENEVQKLKDAKYNERLLK